MMRRLVLGAVLVGAIVVGCKEEKRAGAGRANSSSASSGAAERPKAPPTASALWTQDQVEAWIREDLGLVEMSLTPGSGGSFTGTGKDERGVSYKLKVTQKPGQIVLDHEYPAPTAPGQMAKGQIRFGGK
jgi:hypothetical protein